MKIIFNKPHSLSIFRETHIVEGINTICVFSNDIGYRLSFILANINFKNDEKMLYQLQWVFSQQLVY